MNRQVFVKTFPNLFKGKSTIQLSKQIPWFVITLFMANSTALSIGVEFELNMQRKNKKIRNKNNKIIINQKEKTWRRREVKYSQNNITRR